MDIIISVIGALTAIIVASVGAFLANRNSNLLQLRKLKEQHYIVYFEALHNLAANNKDKKTVENYTYYRDKLFIIASEKVVKNILKYEEEAVGKSNDLHDQHLTEIVKAIRQDLRIKDKCYPTIYLKHG